MRPIDRKLKYQIDKLIRTAKTGVAGEFCFELSSLTYSMWFFCNFLVSVMDRYVDVGRTVMFELSWQQEQQCSLLELSANPPIHANPQIHAACICHSCCCEAEFVTFTSFCRYSVNGIFMNPYFLS